MCGRLLMSRVRSRRSVCSTQGVAPNHEFINVKNESDWEQFLSRCPDEMKQRIEKESAAEQCRDRSSTQASLL